MVKTIVNTGKIRVGRSSTDSDVNRQMSKQSKTTYPIGPSWVKSTTLSRRTREIQENIQIMIVVAHLATPAGMVCGNSEILKGKLGPSMLISRYCAQ